jgi:hypothetical protein
MAREFLQSSRKLLYYGWNLLLPFWPEENSTLGLLFINDHGNFVNFMTFKKILLMICYNKIKKGDVKYGGKVC